MYEDVVGRLPKFLFSSRRLSLSQSCQSLPFLFFPHYSVYYIITDNAQETCTSKALESSCGTQQLPCITSRSTETSVNSETNQETLAIETLVSNDKNSLDLVRAINHKSSIKHKEHILPAASLILYASSITDQEQMTIINFLPFIAVIKCTDIEYRRHPSNLKPAISNKVTNPNLNRATGDVTFQQRFRKFVENRLCARKMLDELLLPTGPIFGDIII
ncbi:hypothetical protein GQX74_014885 [Glossina fuscipes]|nr:hypothetical protein GQX74_014885 [Glossina fuscipes]